MPPDLLTGKLGKTGAMLHRFANGWDASPVRRTDHIRAVQSVGNSATSPRNLETNEDVHLMLLLLSESVCARMRELASKCTVVELSVVYRRPCTLC